MHTHAYIHLRENTHVYIAHYVAKVVIEEEKKGRKPRTNTPHTNKPKMARTPGYPALRTGMMG